MELVLKSANEVSKIHNIVTILGCVTVDWALIGYWI
jgi:hypothetical protein